MKKNYFLRSVLLVGILLSFGMVKSQCDTVAISKAGITVHSVTSEETVGAGADNGHAKHAIDDNTGTHWHTQWKDAQPDFPHEIVLDLGQSYAVTGWKFLPRQVGAVMGRLAEYKLYVSSDAQTWGEAQLDETYTYTDGTDKAERTSYFGAQDARYVKIEAISGVDASSPHLVVAEITILRNTCGAENKKNQQITFAEISKKQSDDAPFNLSASASSGLDVEFSIVSGPATVDGNTVTLTGEGGMVTVRASQVGDSEYYPAEAVDHTFEVVKVSEVTPTVDFAQLTDEFKMQMKSIKAYVLTAHASINHSELVSVESVVFEEGGNVIQTVKKGDAYYGAWTPSGFGSRTVKVTATASNGQTASKSVTVDVSSTSSDLTEKTFSYDEIRFDGTGHSQWLYGNYELPQFVGVFDQIVAKLRVTCPTGGCDDWDRVAWIDIKHPEGHWVELIRYITPYGVACNHVLDVTEFASLLQGKVELRMYIETWAKGWEISLDFDYNTGTPEYDYSRVDVLWDGIYQFGDMDNLQPCEHFDFTFANNAKAAKLWLVTSGHGWGENNTGNAAEFFDATHHIMVDGQATYTQRLNTNCNPNPDGCTGQLGTWQYTRAGWCPGAIAEVFKYDMTSLISRQTVDMHYRFMESYKDNCHPSNPNCVTGQTCADCNAGYNPHYVVAGNVMTFSDTPIIPDGIGTVGQEDIEHDQLGLQVYPNPTTDGIVKISSQEDFQNARITVFDVTGKMVTTYFADNQMHMNQLSIDLGAYPAGNYYVRVLTDDGKIEITNFVKQ